MEFIKKKWKLSKKSGNYKKKMNILSKKNITHDFLKNELYFLIFEILSYQISNILKIFNTKS